MNGWDIGTKCVITFNNHLFSYQIGTIVTIYSEAFAWKSGERINVRVDLPSRSFTMDNRTPQIDGTVVQIVVYNGGPSAFVHPVDWMRPLDFDIDYDKELLTEELPSLIMASISGRKEREKEAEFNY